MDELPVKVLGSEHCKLLLGLVEKTFAERRFVWGCLEGNIVRVFWHM